MQNIPNVTSSYISPMFDNYVSKGPVPRGFKTFIDNGTASQFVNAIKTKNEKWMNENYMNHDTCMDYYMAQNIKKMDWGYFEEWWKQFSKIMDAGGFEPANDIDSDSDSDTEYVVKTMSAKLYNSLKNKV